MTTRNLVPRADGEGSLGTAAKQWGAMRAKNIYIDGVDVTEAVTSTEDNAEAAASSATAASNSASSASTTATQLMAYLETKETLTAPAIDPTLTISGAGADAQVTGYKFKNIEESTVNFLDIQDKTQRTTNGITWSVSNQMITANGTSTGNGDITLTLKTPVTLEPGSYRLTFDKKLIEGVSISVYFSTNAGMKYTTTQFPVYPLNLTEQETLDYILIRFYAGTTVNFQAKAELIKGNFVPANYIPNVSAVDVNLREDLFEKSGALGYLTKQVIKRPIFSNGGINNGVPEYSNTGICNYSLVTDKIYKVKAGSVIKYIGDLNAFLVIAFYDNNGTVVNDVQIAYDTTFKNYYFYQFTEDANVRFFVRYLNYANIVPANAFELFDFSLITETPQDKSYQCMFVGSRGDNLSGQMQLVKLPNGKNLLLDSHRIQYYSGVHDFLRDNGVRKIDYYVQSHWHSDHIGLLQMLKSQPTWVDISNMVAFLPQLLTVDDIPQITERETVVTAQNEMIAFLEQNNCTIIRPTEKQVYELTDGIRLRFYNTYHSIYSDSSSGYYSTNYNDWSLCCELLYGKTCINFSADIGPIGERYVAGTLNKANILTAPHHGWDNHVNGLVASFINNVNPDTVISVNGWEHKPDNTDSPANIMLPTSAMQSFCEANCVSNYPTFLNGAITITVDENGWKFDGQYSRYIRNGKNWKFNDNTDKQE